MSNEQQEQRLFGGKPLLRNRSASLASYARPSQSDTTTPPMGPMAPSRKDAPSSLMNDFTTESLCHREPPFSPSSCSSTHHYHPAPLFLASEAIAFSATITTSPKRKAKAPMCIGGYKKKQLASHWGQEEKEEVCAIDDEAQHELRDPSLSPLADGSSSSTQLAPIVPPVVSNLGAIVPAPSVRDEAQSSLGTSRRSGSRGWASSTQLATGVRSSAAPLLQQQRWSYRRPLARIHFKRIKLHDYTDPYVADSESSDQDDNMGVNQRDYEELHKLSCRPEKEQRERGCSRIGRGNRITIPGSDDEMEEEEGGRGSEG